jgi:hypothetical protein
VTYVTCRYRWQSAPHATEFYKSEIHLVGNCFCCDPRTASAERSAAAPPLAFAAVHDAGKLQKCTKQKTETLHQPQHIPEHKTTTHAQFPLEPTHHHQTSNHLPRPNLSAQTLHSPKLSFCRNQRLKSKLRRRSHGLRHTRHPGA